MGIQRWDYSDERMNKASDGDYVRFTDHKQVVADKDKTIRTGVDLHYSDISKFSELVKDRDREIIHLRAELAAKSKDAARWDWIMNNYYGGDLTRTQKVIGACFSREAMEAAIDKDLGE